LVHGKPSGLKHLGHDHSIALGNKNLVLKIGPDDDSDDNKDEEKIKKGVEVGQKRHHEELNKISLEERSKKIDLQRKKVKNEQQVQYHWRFYLFIYLFIFSRSLLRKTQQKTKWNYRFAGKDF
jgi:hypothetical protein